MDFVSNFAVPIVCKTKKTREEKKKKCAGLIEIRPIVGGDITKQPFFTKYIKLKGLPGNANLVHEQGLYFGNNPELTNEEIKLIIKTFTP